MAGTRRKSVSSNAVITVRTSSSGPIPADRSCAVRQSRSTSSRSARRVSASWPPPSRESSRTVSRAATRRSDATTARRRASVGWAVNTLWTRSPASCAVTRSAPCSAVIRATASASDSRGGRSPEPRSCRARTRCCSSARLTRWKYTVNARATCSARSWDQVATRATMSSSIAAAPDDRPAACRAAITACRSRSTSGSRVGSSSLMISPRISPSSLTSPRIASGSSAESRSLSPVASGLGAVSSLTALPRASVAPLSPSATGLLLPSLSTPIVLTP